MLKSHFSNGFDRSETRRINKKKISNRDRRIFFINPPHFDQFEGW